MDKLIDLINVHKVISFDIFDTLLLRPYLSPTDLFEHIERLFNVKGFKKSRINAEKKAREQSKSKEEITLDDIYDLLPHELKFLKQEEQNLEKRILIPNKEMIYYFNYAKKIKKRVIITSDMYLPICFIEDCLKDKGIAGYDKLYLSSKIGKTKIKNLFSFILNEEQILPNELIHIGDNENCDYLKPLTLGIDSFYYKNVSNQFFERNPKAKQFWKINNTFESSVFLKILAIYNHNNRKVSYEERFGFEYAGLAYLVFSQWIKQQGEKDKISDYLFVARDGYILKKVFDKLYPESSTRYIYANRQIRLANSLELAIKKNKCYALLYGLIQSGVISTDLLKLINNEKTALDYVNTHYNEINHICRMNNDEYKNYINTFKFRGNRIAIIDTDSAVQNLTSLNLLSPFLGKHIKVKFFLWSLVDSMRNDISHVINYSNEQIRTMSEHLGFKGYKEWIPLEMIMSSPEPPIVGIKDNKPIYSKELDPSEKKREIDIKKIENSAVDFIKSLRISFGETLNFDESFFKKWWNLLFEFSDIEDLTYWKNTNYSFDQNHLYKICPCNKSLIPEIIEKLSVKLTELGIKHLYLYCANDLCEVVLPLLLKNFQANRLPIEIPLIFDQNADTKFISNCNISIKVFSPSLLKDNSMIFIASTTVDKKIKFFLERSICNKNDICVYSLNDF